LNLEKETDKRSLNSFLREIALHSPMREQIDFTTSTEIVSTDLVGLRVTHACYTFGMTTNLAIAAKLFV